MSVVIRSKHKGARERCQYFILALLKHHPHCKVVVQGILTRVKEFRVGLKQERERKGRGWPLSDWLLFTDSSPFSFPPSLSHALLRILGPPACLMKKM